MKVTEDGDKIVVTMSRTEAYKVFNFVEYATRENMKWTGEGLIQSCVDLSKTYGRKKSLRLAEALLDVIGDMP